MAESLLWVLCFRPENVLNADPSDIGIECVNYNTTALLKLTSIQGPWISFSWTTNPHLPLTS
jgi:hypothetical protein